METKVAEFIKLIDQAIQVAEQLQEPQSSKPLEGVLTALESLRKKALEGQLEPSNGTTTLGLSRGISDWIEPLDSPLLKSVGQIEAFYQTQL